MVRPIPTDIEIKFDGGNMITETDLSGDIVYANRLFLDMHGYSQEELIGSPHSIIRHPEMPKQCFEEMWRKLKMGTSWEGYVKNLCKDGSYCWMIVFVTPKFDDNGKITGYLAIRKPPGEQTLEKVKKLYENMNFTLSKQFNLPSNNHADRPLIYCSDKIQSV